MALCPGPDARVAGRNTYVRKHRQQLLCRANGAALRMQAHRLCVHALASNSALRPSMSSSSDGGVAAPSALRACKCTAASSRSAPEPPAAASRAASRRRSISSRDVCSHRFLSCDQQQPTRCQSTQSAAWRLQGFLTPDIASMNCEEGITTHRPRSQHACRAQKCLRQCSARDFATAVDATADAR